ncbi:MAG: butyrate kinase [Ignavibacteriales bacterium]|nr:butyrate kinase [Ignavibacteriales bacterium]
MSENYTILVINPGSTSTKLAIYVDGIILQTDKVVHSAEELKNFKSIWDQYQFRMEVINRWVEKNVTCCSAVVAMGGLLKPVQGGVYFVNQKMIDDARGNLQGEHASNLGCVMAHEISKRFSCPALIADPVSVDEFEPLAFYSGHPQIKRRPLSHALNIHAIARRAASELNLHYNQSAFIICHLGGGISIAPVRDGMIIDVNDASSDGPFSPERTGGLPLQPFITVAMSGKYTESELRKFVMGQGGLIAYLKTNSIEEVERRIIQGDEFAEEVYKAMAYQIAKEIGAMATVLAGKIDAIVLSGGIAYSNILTSWIIERVQFIGKVLIFPGEDEMQALAEAGMRILKNEEQAKEY